MARTKEEVVRALRRLASSKKQYWVGEEHNQTELEGLQELASESLKLIESQPEVVMCKDCRHYDGYVCKHEVRVRSREPEWHCADAWKRKDEK